VILLQGNFGLVIHGFVSSFKSEGLAGCSAMRARRRNDAIRKTAEAYKEAGLTGAEARASQYNGSGGVAFVEFALTLHEGQ
jgi:hypothetical protein